MKTFVKDLNLNQEELNATINLLKSIKECIPICKRIIKDYEVKNSVKTIISDLLDYTIDNLSKQLKSENDDIITKDNNKTSSYIKKNKNNKTIKELKNRLLNEDIYITIQGDTFQFSELLKSNDNNKSTPINDLINTKYKRNPLYYYENIHITIQGNTFQFSELLKNNSGRIITINDLINTYIIQKFDKNYLIDDEIIHQMNTLIIKDLQKNINEDLHLLYI